MTVVKAAVVQISPVLNSREGIVEKVVEKIIALGHEGVQFAAYPEAIVPYYRYFSTLQRPIALVDQQLLLLDQSVTVPSDATRASGDACAQAGIVVSVGVNERDGSTIYNTQLLFDAARLGEHLAAGADHVAVQVLGARRRRDVVPALEELAGALYARAGQR
jgi:nitrilase